MKRRVFISHKNTSDSNKAGAKIKEYLDTINCLCFLDDTSLEGGMNWDEAIIDSLLESDVIVVLLDRKTVESEWVQREIDMAKARSISILPVALDEFSEIETALKRFNLERKQFITFDPYELEKSIQNVGNQIERLTQETIANQKTIADSLISRQNKKVKKTPGHNDPAALKFTHPNIPGIEFCIATGDASKVTDYDVLVNTENTYMQMARFFETSTLSYAIRTAGAHFDEGVVLLEDTIQDELYHNAHSRRGLPVIDGRVLVTSAGHRSSPLQRFTNYRYVFHVAAVRVSVKNRSIEPIHTVDKFIVNCVNKIEKIDREQGAVILPNGDELIPVDENYEPIDSILFPAFGAGNGGKPLEVAVGEIVTCFEREVADLINNLGLHLKRIGLSIYFQDDTDLVTEIFEHHNFELVSKSD